jgi:ATP-dependent helicase HrpB
MDRTTRQQFEEWAPEKIEVPSGSHIRIDYDTDPPKLSVRLQELFGLAETPKIAGGRVAILMELLSPGFKPMQLTRDLKSFWNGAYFEVKKELKAQYPKHSWPDDPWTAQAVAKGRRRPS